MDDISLDWVFGLVLAPYTLCIDSNLELTLYMGIIALCLGPLL